MQHPTLRQQRFVPNEANINYYVLTIALSSFIQQLHQGRRASGVHAANNTHDLLLGRDLNAVAASPNASGIPGTVDREANAFGLQRRQKK